MTIYKFCWVFLWNKRVHKQQKTFEEYYNEHCLSDLVVYDGIAKLIDDLNDFTLAVATNANSQYAYKMLNHVGLAKSFLKLF